MAYDPAQTPCIGETADGMTVYRGEKCAESRVAAITCPFFVIFGTRFRNVSLTGTYYRDVSVILTTVSRYVDAMDIFGGYVGFPGENRRIAGPPISQEITESAKSEAAIRSNLEGLGYGA